MLARELDRATFIPAFTSLQQALGADQVAQDTLKAIVYYVGRLEQTIDIRGGWNDV